MVEGGAKRTNKMDEEVINRFLHNRPEANSEEYRGVMLTLSLFLSLCLSFSLSFSYIHLLSLFRTHTRTYIHAIKKAVGCEVVNFQNLFTKIQTKSRPN